MNVAFRASKHGVGDVPLTLESRRGVEPGKLLSVEKNGRSEGCIALYVR